MSRFFAWNRLLRSRAEGKVFHRVLATWVCDASQGIKAGFSRSPSMRMSEPMSQGIFRLLIKLPYLGFDCIRRALVGIKSPIGAEQAGSPLPAHEV